MIKIDYIKLSSISQNYFDDNDITAKIAASIDQYQLLNIKKDRKIETEIYIILYQI